ncbi:MAG: hypothetical protein NDI73_05360 [Desulfuromonadales bacterium]|nr:hypothetical protein [Desulfuromonadales bacterium]
MTSNYSSEVANIRQMFELCERAEGLEEKAEYFEEAMQAAKDALDGCDDEHAQRVVTNLKMAYTRKLLESIASTGEKTTNDLLNLLTSLLSAWDCLERVREEHPDLSEKYEQFLSLVRKDHVIINAFTTAVKN